MPSMRAVRTTSISFGLVNVPVKMYKAVDSHDVSFHQYHAGCMGGIGYVKSCKECGEKCNADTIVRGVDNLGTITTVSDDELASIEVQAGPEIAVQQFIEASEIDPIAFEGHYYLAPDKTSVEGYALLRQVMVDTGRAAIVRFVMRRSGSVGKSHLGLMRPYGDKALAIHTMSYPDEIRQPAFDVLDKTIELKPALVDMAHQLVDAMTGPFIAAEYTDTFTDKLEELIAVKQAGGEPAAALAASVEPTDISDLLAKLEASTAARRAFAKANKQADDNERVVA